VAISYVFTAATLVVNLVTGIIVVRLLGVAGRGEVAAILAFTQVATWVFAMGCNQAASFHLARHPDQGGVLIGSWLVLLAPFAVLGVVGGPASGCADGPARGDRGDGTALRDDHRHGACP
jgi:O-antigen/teichoic acid export membrane protein